MRAALAGTAATLAAWVMLLAALGNVDLQRSVAIGPTTLLERPLAIVATLAVAGVVAHAVVRGGTVPTSWGGAVAASIATTVVGSAVLAPLAVGELEIGHASGVFLVISLFGMVFVAIAAGTITARRRSGPVSRDG